VSGHWWGRTGAKPKGPSEFLTELSEVDDAAVDQWAPPPAQDEENPIASAARIARWPIDPLGKRRQDVLDGADQVRAEWKRLRKGKRDEDQLLLPLEDDDPDGWKRDTDVLLAERAAAMTKREKVTLPGQLSVSQLVELAADPEALARRLRRPLPFPPNPVARRGTAFHTWLERRFGSGRLLDLDELPGAADDGAAIDDELEALRDAFLASSWADRIPHEVEVPFTCDVDGLSVRGRMDAVYSDEDGGWTVVDWKTGKVPDKDHLPALAVQLAAYRLAWAQLSNVPVDRVRAAFHYVRHDHTLRPADLLDADGLRALVHSVPSA
jgi:DNA helicase-2/ATP-dependent DNA helicase PcrA